ncbi:MAG: cyclic pyranopterin monophosphate synthase MoaC [Desulfurella sp.]|uniref:Cyclic pyranopterin monophosphate synthase n=1 Tax=Desulfurella multipotens TaxID=79269 RepID=A0A1G6J177_9BACT|nr:MULTISPECIES: cyclic pyranopterin monophosphate synthase MoaC [Desulfurella]AHF97483.1 molybdenum cofactor biosynthesis protein C [Desulfurella acetivorans A63]HEX12856.1 cyclic pyranopterin monophosphate synthase MoaC [Desulfurella acetivorans]PMP68891.1 MAG: cyclic pyranopterin monophosphate synthase MoaC [Desulfurella multipotens]PMP89404.1 MAG: cyclic pyranopterin monophosphate synthase MoaC [Desulfurella sp.]SDC12602.1 cyclic pyranopterin phosphate synthase [Desulfurella multipotens]
MEFTHFNKQNKPTMVDVSNKEATLRIASAQAIVRLSKQAYIAVKEGTVKKGDVLSVASTAGIMGAKQTPHLIPMCHPLNIEQINIDFELNDEDCTIRVISTAKITAKTGVEMESLCACSIAALTIYDMCKSIDKSIEITDIYLLKKSGGKSGDFERQL